MPPGPPWPVPAAIWLPGAPGPVPAGAFAPASPPADPSPPSVAAAPSPPAADASPVLPMPRSALGVASPPSWPASGAPASPFELEGAPRFSPPIPMVCMPTASPLFGERYTTVPPTSTPARKTEIIRSAFMWPRYQGSRAGAPAGGLRPRSAATAIPRPAVGPPPTSPSAPGRRCTAGRRRATAARSGRAARPARRSSACRGSRPRAGRCGGARRPW